MVERGGCGPYREHAIQHVAPDEGLWRTCVEERQATKRRESVSFAVNRDLGGKISVVERSDAAVEAGVVFCQREGGVNTRRGSENVGAVVAGASENS